MTLDYLIFGSYVITMEGPGTGVIPNGAVGVSGNRIVVVGDADTVRKSYRAHHEIDATGKAIMPGFVDAHMHTGDAIVRSCAQDLPGDIWRIRGILPLLGGASLLALKSGCDVVPVYIEGHYKPFRRMVVHVGKPIEMADLRAGRMNKETCDALTERMEAAFARLSGGKSLPPAEKTPA